MAITAPELTAVKAAFPSIKEIEFLDAGGFKAVYKVSVGAKAEALKIIELHTSIGASGEDKDRERAELWARINREVTVLGVMDIPELVKLRNLSIRMRHFLTFLTHALFNRFFFRRFIDPYLFRNLLDSRYSLHETFGMIQVSI